MPKKEDNIIQKYYKVLTDTSPDCIKLFDLKGNLKYINRGGLKEHGLKSSEEAIKMGWQAIETIIPKDRPKFTKALKDATEGKISTIEIRHTEEGANREVCLETVAPVKDDKGKITEVFGVSRDISEIKKTERELSESLSLIEATLDSTADGILVVDTEGKVLQYNNRFAKMWRIDKDVLATSRDEDMFNVALGYFDDPEEFLSKVKSLYATPEQTSTDELYLSDGRIFERYSCPQWQDGEVTGRVWSFRDITERKQVGEKLKTQKERLNNILEGTNVGTWEWNVQTGETIFNEKWANLIGYTLKEISPVSIDTWMKFAHPDDLKKSDELLKKHFNGELDYYHFESRIKHKDGHWIWVLDRGKVISRDEDGKPLWAFGTHQDITKRKQAEELERVMTKVSTNLINTEMGEIDGRIDEILERVGEFAGADRVYIFQFYDDLERMDNTHEWCSEGVESQKDDLQGLPTNTFPWWMERLKDFESILIPRVSDLPPEAEAEKEILQAQDIKSLIVLPMISDDSLMGFIGFDWVEKEKESPEEIINLLRVAGGSIASALYRKKTEEEKEEEREKLERINDIMVDREKKMVELKEEIEELKKKLKQ